MRATVSRRARAQITPAVRLLGAAAHHQAGSGRCQATSQMGALHVPKSKKNAKAEGAVIVFEDEASFRQTPSLHATWAKRGSQPQIPTRGERHTQRFLEPSVWTTPVSSIFISRII